MSAIFLHAQVQFHDKYPLFDSQSDCEFTFSYVILCIPQKTQGVIFWSLHHFNNGDKTKWSSIQSVIIWAINKIGWLRSGSPIW